jgi:hypothetical protein
MNLPRTAWLAASFILLPLFAQAGAGVTDVADEDPGLFLMMMFLLAGFIGVCILAAGAALVALAVCCCMIFAGTLTVSILAGWYRQSATSGLKAFVRLLFTLFGCLAGALAGWILRIWLVHSPSSATVIADAAASGGAAGWLIANLLLATARRLLQAGRSEPND